MSNSRVLELLSAFQAVRVNRMYRQAIKLRSVVETSQCNYAAKRKASLPLKVSCLVHTAHMIRAILFASATVALL